MTAAPPVEIVHRFFSGTGCSYDAVVKLCTLGADLWWKRVLVAALPPRPTAVLDQASGTGILTFQIARRFPGCRVVGVELRREYLAVAWEKARLLGLSDVQFVQGRAEAVFLRRRFDAVTSSYLAKYADLRPLVANARDMLEERGRLVVHDFTYPKVRLFARIWEAYFRLLQSAGARAYPEWREAFFGLPALLRTTTWVPDLVACLREQGFADIRTRSLTFGSAALVTANRGDRVSPRRRIDG